MDYLDTFSPVAKIATVKVLLTLAISFNWPVAQMDVNNEFLNGDLFEEVYMSLPLGYKVIDQRENLVCRLNKSINGLKQASRQWFVKFSTALLRHGFTQSKSDYSLFTRGSGITFAALLVYVDDILITGPSGEHIGAVKTLLSNLFFLKDLGSMKYFLGLEIARSSAGIFLSQQKYCLQILEDVGFQHAKPASTPMDPNVKLSKIDGVPLSLEEAKQYRRFIGRLLYLQISRPDICFSVHKLSQFLQAPTTSHLHATHHLLRYLKGTPSQGILLKPVTHFQLKAFVDADWGSCLDTRRSVTGFCLFLGDTFNLLEVKETHSL